MTLSSDNHLITNGGLKLKRSPEVVLTGDARVAGAEVSLDPSVACEGKTP